MKKGFTLVEIMIVVAIIGLLAAIAIPSFMKARTTAQKNSCINSLRQIESAKDQYAVEKGGTNGTVIVNKGTPADWTNLVGLQTGYIKTNPACPVGSSPAGYEKGMAARADRDYTVNAVGTAPTCTIAGGAATDAHVLQ